MSSPWCQNSVSAITFYCIYLSSCTKVTNCVQRTRLPMLLFVQTVRSDLDRNTDSLTDRWCNARCQTTFSWQGHKNSTWQLLLWYKGKKTGSLRTYLLMEKLNDKHTKSVHDKLTRWDLVNVDWYQVTFTWPLGILHINVWLGVICPWKI